VEGIQQGHARGEDIGRVARHHGEIMQQGDRRNGLIEARNNGWSCSLTAEKNARTPGFARDPLRASLITLVSTKYIAAKRSLRLSREIVVAPHIRHGGQQVCQLAAGWVQQRRCQDGTVLGLSAAAMLSGPLLEGSHHGLLHAPHEQISHGRDICCARC
jgi:hypothetical protein